MGCKMCGCSTPRRLCKVCDRMKNRPSINEMDFSDEPICPTCDRITSGEGVVCFECRKEREEGQ